MKDAILETVLITSLLFSMMLLVEFVHIRTRGRWRLPLSKNRWGQYALAGLLGVTPGCLGAFAVVTLHMHRGLSLGAVVACMIATFGDEAFVMLALIPGQALLIAAVGLVVGIAAGALTDFVLKGEPQITSNECHELRTHEEDEFEAGKVRDLWVPLHPIRVSVLLALSGFILAVVFGPVGPGEWNLIRIALLCLAGLAWLVTAVSSDHFIVEHLWKHIVKGHLARMSLWILGALVFLHLLSSYTDASRLADGSLWVLTFVAALVGVIPDSGPHLVFTTLFADGAIPLSVLITNSIVQDGHGMIPLLAHSKSSFLLVKAINLVAGLLVGFAWLAVSLYMAEGGIDCLIVGFLKSKLSVAFW
ncbi:hypothetical protein VDG1235_4527 [Verrucomicrobiia bacterium DG1235]|nr:hypothetical protein VDG1235_4527 [Verrucomicrobiae bacterium DG1235]